MRTPVSRVHLSVLVVLVVALLAALLAPTTPLYSQQGDFVIGTPAFQRVWSEQDGPVADDLVDRSWTWGPQPISPLLTEPLLESPGGMRQVQYFDKSRMEINDPNDDPTSQWYVTNGLLPLEMMNGEIQVGFETFEDATPANISAIGDPDTFPTYAQIAPLYESPGALDRNELGQPVTRLLRPDGTTGSLTTYSDDPATVLIEGDNGHGIPRGFFEFQNSQGLIYLDGQPTNGQVYFPKFVFGLPVTAPYWVSSRVAGEEQEVLFQVFERRVLTYNPANPPGFRVEMGNVGQHYYRWRYGGEGNEVVAPTPVPETETATPEASPYPEPTTPEDEEATPTPEDEEATPTPEDEEATPTPEDEEATPTPEDEEATPTPEDEEEPTSDPDPASDDDLGFFGMNTYITGLERGEQDGTDGIARLVGLGREAGVTWAREEISWANIEPDEKSNWNWPHYDQHILQLSQAGYSIIGVLQTTPEWARVGDCGSREGRQADYWCPPASAQDFADFTAAVVERYDGDGNADAPGSPRVAAWQIWNEPSTRQTWPGSPEEYGALLVAAYDAAKSADPSTVVATGGLYIYDGLGTDPNDGIPFMNNAIASNATVENAFDVLAVHPYMPTSAPDAPIIFASISLWGRIETAQNWLRAHPGSRGERPLWISEIGWSTCDSGAAGCNGDVAKSEEQQANYLVRTHALALAQGVQHVNYFQLEDKFDGSSQVFWGEASLVAPRGEGYRTKPAFRAYQVMTGLLGGARFEGFGAANTFDYNPNIESPVDLFHVRFRNGNGDLIDVLWRNDAEQVIRLQPEAGYQAELITRDGERSAIPAAGLDVTISEVPIYMRQVTN